MTKQAITKWAENLHTGAMVIAVLGLIGSAVAGFALAPQDCSTGLGGFSCERSVSAVLVVGGGAAIGVVVTVVPWFALAKVLEIMALTLPEERQRGILGDRQPNLSQRVPTSELAPPESLESGWYPDPRGARYERRWDGERWTEDRRMVDR